MPDHKKRTPAQLKQHQMLVEAGEAQKKRLDKMKAERIKKELHLSRQKHRSTRNERLTEEQRKIRESDAAMFAAKREYNASLYKNR